ncbi:hypothetical protein R7Y11_02935 [Mesomycoplasma ovipneumoniae]|uniref:hypothetical protein n=1 Tax=Mesomycoplasma ovipneumoniae TaxID=29562 RepID=UPI002964881B|nr:hypothetical protein [Mesomycoplasma ovipneumoniae]MDW2925129.1 hypothetical protein [Mesomycoplasma ovipneumoniae]
MNLLHVINVFSIWFYFKPNNFLTTANLKFNVNNFKFDLNNPKKFEFNSENNKSSSTKLWIYRIF